MVAINPFNGVDPRIVYVIRGHQKRNLRGSIPLPIG